MKRCDLKILIKKKKTHTNYNFSTLSHYTAGIMPTPMFMGIMLGIMPDELCHTSKV